MSEQQWYYLINQQQYGPITETELADLFRNGTIGYDSYVWAQGMEDWQPAKQVAALAGMLPQIPIAQGQVLQTIGPTRPASVTVFGVLNIIFASLTLICTPVAIITIFMPSQSSRAGSIDPNAVATGWLLFTALLGMICSAIQLASGIGLLNLKKWARQWAVRLSYFGIGWGFFAIIINIILTLTGAFGYQQDYVPTAIIMDFFMLFVGLIYPILLIIFLSKSHIKSACIK